MSLASGDDSAALATFSAAGEPDKLATVCCAGRFSLVTELPVHIIVQFVSTISKKAFFLVNTTIVVSIRNFQVLSNILEHIPQSCVRSCPCRR